MTIHDATPAMADGMTTDPVIARLLASLGINDPVLTWSPRGECDQATEQPDALYLTQDLPIARIVEHCDQYAAGYAGTPVEQKYRDQAATNREYLAVGLTRMVTIDLGSTILRGDVSERRATLLLNEDGTRGAILSSNLEIPAHA